MGGHAHTLGDRGGRPRDEQPGPGIQQDDIADGTGGDLVRPLLCATAEEVRAWWRQNGLWRLPRFRPRASPPQSALRADSSSIEEERFSPDGE